MVEKRVILRYFLIVMIVGVLASILIVLRGGFTGFAVYQDSIEGDFDEGTYTNTEWNGSAVVLSGENLAGTYASQIFDAGDDANWNNISWESLMPDLEYFYAFDNDKDIWRSADGISWTEINNAYFSSDIYGITSTSNGLFIVTKDKRVHKSIDNGANWILVNDAVDIAEEPRGITFVGNDLYVVAKQKQIYKSIDDGASWSLIKNDYTDKDNANQYGIGVESLSTSLDLQVKSCDDILCSGESWTDITDTSSQNLSINDNRYFQYKVSFTSPDSSITSALNSVSIDYDVLDSIPPNISFSSQTTSEENHLADSIFVGINVSDESQMYSFINFNNSLNAFYKLNDTVVTLKDYSGNNYDGTINGASPINGKFGNALNFDGEDTVDCAGAGNFERTDNFSVSVWVKSEPDEGGIIQRYDGTKGWSLFTTASGTLVLDIKHDGSNYIRRRSVNTISDTTWKHMVFTYDGTSTLAGTHIYVNGELDDSSSGSSDTLTDSISTGTSCKIGILHIYGNYRWIGDMDEVLIFNRVLSTEEISALYSASSYSNNFTNLEAGEYNFYAYAQDVQGNENQTDAKVVTLVDNVAPSISIISPQDGASYGYNESLSLNFTITDADDNIDSCWYNLNAGGNITIENCANTTIDVLEGSNTLIIYVNDSLDEEASDSIGFSVQIGAPTIVLHYPIDVYLSNGSNVVFNYTPSDIDLDSCGLLGDFNGEYGVNQTDGSVSSGVVNSFNLELEDREYLWNINCVDDVGNSAVNGNKTFYVDTISPNLRISEPQGRKTSRTGIGLQFSVSDASPLSCFYNLTSSIGTLIVSDVEIENCLSTSFDVASDGNYIIYLRVEDSAENSIIVNSSFNVESSSSPSPPPNGGSGGGGGGGGSLIQTKITKIEVSEIGNIISHEGDKKTLSLNTKNIGTSFLNNCRLLISGEISSWVYVSQVVGIAPGQNIDFIFDLNIPESIEAGDYFGELGVSCDEISESQEIKIIIPGFKLIEIKEIKYEERGLNISYGFDNSNIIGEEVSVEIWVVDDVGGEIKRYVDSFSINREGVIERNVIIELPDDFVGIYSVYFSLSSDLNNFVKQNVVLGKSLSTGFAVFDTTRGKMIGYVVFIIIVCIGVFFAIRGHGKKIHRSKNNFLLGKNKKSRVKKK